MKQEKRKSRKTTPSRKKPKTEANLDQIDQIDATAYTCYWAPHELELFADCPESGPAGLHLTGGNSKRFSHSKLKPGDTYFPLTVRSGQLRVMGKLRVLDVRPANSLTSEEYEQWHQDRNIKLITNCYAPRLLIDVEAERWVQQGVLLSNPEALEWIKPSGESRRFKNTTGKYMTTALNGVYHLSFGSASLLTACLECNL